MCCNCVVQVMRGYFPSILALAQGLLRSPDCCVVPCGGHLYKQAFTAFDSYCQQVRYTYTATESKFKKTYNSIKYCFMMTFLTHFSIQRK